MDPQFFLVLVSLTAASLVVTLALVFKVRRFLNLAARAPGRVTRIEAEEVHWEGYGSDHPEETTTSFRPHVEFTPEGGSPIEFPSRVANPRAPMYQVGETVTVVYDRADPQGTAEMSGPVVWRYPIYSGIVTVLLLLGTAFGKACG